MADPGHTGAGASDGTGRVPVDPLAYCDPASFERERRMIYGRHWLYVGDDRPLAEPGAYVAATVAGFPVLVVNDDGTLRAFENVCRHRGGPLAWDGSGSCTRLVCRYHGWSYGLDGRLRSARDFGADVDAPEGVRLEPVRVARWRGLLFVNLDPAAPDLAIWLGVLVPRCRPFPLEEFVPVHRAAHDIAANWKVYAENYMEGYHIPLVHPGLNRQIDAASYEVDLHGEAAVHRAPRRDGAVTAGEWLWRFPGLALNLYERGLCVEQYWPTGPTGTRVEYTFTFAPGTPRDEIDAAVSSSTAILDEDRTICEAVQRNLGSGLVREAWLSPRHERGVAALQQMVRDALAPAAGAP